MISVFLTLCQHLSWIQRLAWNLAVLETFVSKWKLMLVRYSYHLLDQSCSTILQISLKPADNHDLRYHTSSPGLEPTGKEKSVLPMNYLLNDLENDTKRIGYTWGQPEGLAQDWCAWTALVGSLCTSKGQRQWWWWWWQWQSLQVFFSSCYPYYYHKLLQLHSLSVHISDATS